MGSKVTQGSTRGQFAQECPMITKFSQRTLDHRVIRVWGQKSCKGHPEVFGLGMCYDN